MIKKTLEKAVLNKIERLEAFEERLSVRFENLSIKVYDYGWFTLFCELHSNNGTTIEERIEIECVLYDHEGLILDKKNRPIFKDSFFGFEITEMNFQEDKIADKVSKIRIYPKK